MGWPESSLVEPVIFLVLRCLQNATRTLVGRRMQLVGGRRLILSARHVRPTLEPHKSQRLNATAECVVTGCRCSTSHQTCICSVPERRPSTATFRIC
jgi:hypothetical protein